jgi:8-amino-7-oxononanoate synthase
MSVQPFVADDISGPHIETPDGGRSADGSLSAYAYQHQRRAAASFMGADYPEAVWRGVLHATYFLPLDELKRDFESSGRPFTNFASLDYLGLAEDARVKQATCEAIQRFGLGSGASRLVGGERTVHSALEAAVADFLGVEGALALVSGFMTNVSLVGHLLGRRDLIIADELAHNSILLGGQLSNSPMVRFAHNNLDELEDILATRRGQVGKVLIVVEGLYSMDGDIPDLPRLLALKERYDAWLMIDEAHSIGVLGKTGRGITEHFKIDPSRVDIIMGTLSKALGACGGFIAGTRKLTEWLRFSLPAVIFTVGLPPAVAVGAHQALSILRAEPWRVARVQQNSALFLRKARAHGFDTGPAVGAGIVSLYYRELESCRAASTAALEAGFYAPPIAQVGVPKAKPRIRFFINARHTEEQITAVLDILAAQ